MTIAEITTNLDRCIRWGYSSRKIDGKLLEGFQSVLQSLTEIEPEAEIAQMQSSLSRAAGMITGMERALRFAGITPRGMARIDEIDDSFLDWFARHGFTIQSDADFLAFLAMARTPGILCETDMGNIAYYAKLLGWAGDDRDGKYRPYLQFMRQLCPHLTRYFDDIENGREIDENEANNELYEYHLNN